MDTKQWAIKLANGEPLDQSDINQLLHDCAISVKVIEPGDEEYEGYMALFESGDETRH